MDSTSCLTDVSVPLVVDTSAVINLVASGYAPEIIRALPNRLLVVDAVPAELRLGQAQDRISFEQLRELSRAGLIEAVSLNEAELVVFEELVIGSASETLDDGEAATIACAVRRGFVAIIDEKKATRICGVRFPALVLASSVDLFTHGAVIERLGHSKLAEGVFNSLRDARMSVLPHHLDIVVHLIGESRAAECLSLPATVRRARQRD
jgi:predicted nucleic acid-binding protein